MGGGVLLALLVIMLLEPGVCFPPGTVNGGRKGFGEYCCGLGREWWVIGEGEGGGVGTGGRGVSLIIGEALVWDALVKVACIGVMKFG